MTADDISRLLAARHADDVYVPECKDGRSAGVSHRRLDAWAMAKSWAHPITWGYEIKVSRGDFLADRKWQTYLELCNEFYFVSPWELIDPKELPDEAGLLWVYRNGEGLRLRKKSPRRKIEIPETLWRYLLMCRTKVVADVQYDRVQHLQAMVDDKRRGRELAMMVKRRLLETLDEHERARDKAEQERAELAHIRDRMIELGFNPVKPVSHWDLEHLLRGPAVQAALDALTTADNALLRARTDLLKVQTAASPAPQTPPAS